MSLFQQKILKKQIVANSEKINQAYKLYVDYFHNASIQENIRNSKEEQFQEGFLRELFVKVLGYTLNPTPNYNLITEQKNETNSKKADGAILVNGEVVGIVELKDTKTTDLKTVENQAFGYKNYNRKASYVIISNFEKLRFYIDNAIEFVEFNLFTLKLEEFAVLWLCLAYENIVKDFPKQLKSESVSNEDQITKELYKDYSRFKQELFADLTEQNSEYDKLLLFKKSQKLLDRLLFIFFAEDRNLLPPNSIAKIIDQWEKLKEMDEYRPLYDRFKKYFSYMNTGYKGKKNDIFAYNGGLFKADEVLDNIIISDEILRVNSLLLSQYDFESEVDVNILGHIFENSLTEIEEIESELTSGLIPLRKESKRKKDGVFYTPRYITSYIIENTLGKLCAEKKAKLEIDESEYFTDKKRQLATRKKLDEKLKTYREWLLGLSICDPACGSGAFLNAALDFLIAEHNLLDEMSAKLSSGSLVFQDVENTILENNLYGVDINEESVEIAKLALWLRTAKPNRKLNSLNNNIKCGNSLISDPEIAGDKAFDWQKEFPQVFEEKEKKAFHITTAIHDSRTSQRMIDYKVREKRYNGTLPEPQIYPFSEEDEIVISKTIAQIVKDDKLNIMAYNICRDHIHILLVCETEEVDKIVGKIKGKTARVFNSNKGIYPLIENKTEKSVPVWTQKFGCKEITSDEQLWNTVEYIRNNRIKHGLSDSSSGGSSSSSSSSSSSNKGINPLVDSLVREIAEIETDYEHAFRTEYKGGFDVVIGNPPYVNMTKANTPNLEYYISKYDSVKTANSKNLYTLFNELSISLVKENGIVSFIIPEGFLKTRSYADCVNKMSDNGQIIKAVYFEDWVFEDATTGSMIFEFVKNKNLNTFEVYSFNKEKEIFKIEEIINPVIRKYNDLSFPLLSDIADLFKGMAVKNRAEFIYSEKGNNTDIFLLGNCIDRYKIKNKFYTNYSQLTIVGGTKNKQKHDISPRILIRRTGNFLCCVLLTEPALTESTLYSCSIKQSNIDIKYLIVILNSKLLTYIVQQSMITNAQAFPQIMMTDIQMLKIPDIENSYQQPFIEKADLMLSLNAELQTKRQKFLNRLKDNFDNIKITGALEKFDELDFKKFMGELKKQKIALSLKQQDEWDEYFNEYKSECNQLSLQMAETDKAIDKMVYKLYELTEEEIALVEGTK